MSGLTLREADHSGLIREAYRIDGIGLAECRTIFLDWAMKLPAAVPPDAAIALLLETYAPGAPDHPMTAILREGQGAPGRSGRRGGAGARRSR